MSLIPTEAFDKHIAILGKTGSGKTYAAKVIVESLLRADRHVCVIDPTSAWWGLRLGADGRRKGFDIPLIGGNHGDLPLSPRSGSAVARLVTEQGARVVVDTVGLSVGEHARWFIDFAETFYSTVRSPVHLVIDEAHTFMPQATRAPNPQAGAMVHAGNRLMSGGRSRGIRAMMITQRPAKLHKDSLTCADTLIAMRVVAPQDRKAVKEWIDGAADPEMGTQVIESLAGLKRGHGWVWFPEGDHLKLTAFPKISTFDSSAAPVHGAGDAPAPAKIDLAEVRAAMAEAVREAEENDPKALKSRIATLQAELARKAPSVDVEKIREEAASNAAQKYTPICARLSKAVQDAVRGLVDAQNFVKDAMEAVLVPTAFIRQDARVTRPRPQRAQSNADLPGPHQKIIDAARWWECMGVSSPTAAQVAFVAGYSAGGGTVNTYYSALSTAGLITRGSGTIELTNEGRAAANDPGVAPTTEQLHGRIMAVLSAPHAKLLTELIKHGRGASVPSSMIAEGAGYAPGGGTVNTYFSRLSSLGLIERRAGNVTATSVVWP